MTFCIHDPTSRGEQPLCHRYMILKCLGKGKKGRKKKNCLTNSTKAGFTVESLYLVHLQIQSLDRQRIYMYMLTSHFLMFTSPSGGEGGGLINGSEMFLRGDKIVQRQGWKRDVRRREVLVEDAQLCCGPHPSIRDTSMWDRSIMCLCGRSQSRLNNGGRENSYSGRCTVGLG